MNKNILMTGLLATMSIATSVVNAEPNYPAPFEQVILYQNPDLVSQKTESPAPSKAETNKPVANQAPVSPTPTVVESSAKETSEPTETVATQVEKPDDLSMGSYQVGLIVMVLAGLIFWSMRQPEA